MGIVRSNRASKICATCDFWDGPREDRDAEVSFNNRDNGICRGSSFNGWKMGAVSTCTDWEIWKKSLNRSCKHDSSPVKNPTPQDFRAP